jgi:hypothetical protein
MVQFLHEHVAPDLMRLTPIMFAFLFAMMFG